MDKEDFYFLLWGIGVAFVLQVFYDGIGDFLSGFFNIPKFYAGVSLVFVFFAFLFLFGYYYKGKKSKKGS